MLPKNRAPIHPGEILLEEFLTPLGITQVDFAKHLGWTVAKLNEIIKGKRSITAESALALAAALGVTPQSWLNMQASYDLWHAQKNAKKTKPHPKIKKVS